MTERRADRAILYDRILEQCLALRTGEHFALIADSANGHDALALYEFAERHTSECTLVLAGANELNSSQRHRSRSPKQTSSSD